MSIIKWEPRKTFNPFFGLTRMHDDLDRLFSSVWRSQDDNGDFFPSDLTPAVDIYEEKDNLVIKADMPGIDSKDLDINITGDTLTIKGQKQKEEETKEKGYYRKERIFGSFQRSIVLPSTVNPDKVEASCKNGVLEITLPKKEEAKPKQISVKVDK